MEIIGKTHWLCLVNYSPFRQNWRDRLKHLFT